LVTNGETTIRKEISVAMVGHQWITTIRKEISVVTVIHKVASIY
jgi:hypothetical protein